MNNAIEQQAREKFEEWADKDKDMKDFLLALRNEEMSQSSHGRDWNANRFASDKWQKLSRKIWQSALRTHNSDTEGYVLVPKEPTEAMLTAGDNALIECGIDLGMGKAICLRIYKAMINVIGEDDG